MIAKLTRGRAALGRLYAKYNGFVSFLGAPVVADDDRIVTAVDFANGARTIAAQPDVPRNLTITMADANASVTGGTVTIIGEDVLGRVITDAWAIITNLGVKTTTNVYAKVTSVTVAGLTGVVTGGADQVKVGVGTVVGLPLDITTVAAVKHVFFGGARIASPTIAVGVGTSGVDVSGSTYDGSKLFSVFHSE